MDSPRELTDRTIFVKGSRIVAVGPASTTIPSAGAQVVDGRSRYLMPGLADMHAHLNDRPSMAVLVANGVTTVRNMWGGRAHLAWRDAITRGELLGPTIHTAGPIVDGVPPVWDGSMTVRNAEEARSAVDAQHASGYEFIKVLAKLSPEAYDAIAAESARVGIPFAGHVPWAVGLEHVLASHQKSIEHLDGYFAAAQRDDSPMKDLPVPSDLAARMRMIDYVDEAKLTRLAVQTRDAATWNCPTLVVWKELESNENPKSAFERPELRFVSPQTRASWDPTKDSHLKDTLTPETFARMRRANALRLVLVKRLHDAGARLLLGTDFPNPFVVPGFSVHRELANFVAAGLTPYEALRTGTEDAAEYLGDDFGEVAVGKRADLILLDGDPLLDVANAAKQVGVMLRGKWHPQSELREALERAANAWDPSSDRLATLAPLASGQPPNTYRATYSGVFSGQERWAIQATRDRERIVFAQAAYDEMEPGSLVTELRERIDARGAVRELDLRRSGFTGTLAAHLTITAGRMTGDAHVGDGAAVVVDAAVARDAVPLPGPVGAWQIVAERAHALAVGAKLELDAFDLDVEPAVHVVAVREHVERLADERGLRRYAVATRARTAGRATSFASRRTARLRSCTQSSRSAKRKSSACTEGTTGGASRAERWRRPSTSARASWCSRTRATSQLPRRGADRAALLQHGGRGGWVHGCAGRTCAQEPVVWCGHWVSRRASTTGRHGSVRVARRHERISR